MKLTIRQLIENSDMPEKLIRATIRQIDGIEEFNRVYQDVCNHGANAGFNGFIYSIDCHRFYKRNRLAIFEYASKEAPEIGYSGIFEMVQDLNCLRDYKLTPDEIAAALYLDGKEYESIIIDAMAWYILESLCRDAERITEETK